MKIIFDYRVLTHVTYTGVENYAKNIFESIKEKCSITISKPKSGNKYSSHLWTHFILPFKSGDVLFCPANIAPVFVPKRKKLVVTIHDVAFLTHPKSFSTFFRIYYKLIIPFTINRADKIITVSKYSKSEIEKYYPKSKKKIEVIYLGVDHKYKVLDNNHKKEQVLYVGSMNKRKNFIGLLQAFSLMKSNYKLIIVGNFSSNFEIDIGTQNELSKAKKNNNIIFLSNVDDDRLVKLYNESKLFVFPSFYEGFGLPVLEAMTCGTPVVCSNSSSLPEVGGDSVVYCNPYDVEDIKNKIELVLNNIDLQKEMICKGLERAKLFTWEKSAQQHIKVFEKLQIKENKI